MMRSLHRWAMLPALLLLFYFATTGVLLQGSDMLAVVGHNATEIGSIRDGSAGPPGYIGMNPPPADATPLPAGSTAAQLRAALASYGNQPVGSVELRGIAGRAETLITTTESPARVITLDGASGKWLGSEIAAPSGPFGGTPSRHDAIKTWHRGNIVGTPGVMLNVLAALLLALLTITGVVVYLQMLRQRGAAGLRGLFWPGGGWFRRFHRWIALCASLFLLTMAVSGFLIGFDELMVSLSGTRMMMMAPQASPALPAIAPADLTRALDQTTQLAAQTHPGKSLLAVKLRIDQGHLQGIIWTDGVIPQPALFDLGANAEVTSPAAGQTNRAFGLPWKYHQIAKRLHRGDLIGLSGRAVDLLTGLSLLFLVISGGKIYWDLWRGRRGLGRCGLFW